MSKSEMTVDNMTACAHCGAMNRDSSHHCAECGEVLSQTLVVPTDEEAIELRKQAQGALKSAYKWITGVMSLYRIGAPIYGLVTFAAIFALSQTEVPVEGGVLVIVMTGAMALLLALGALHVLFHPIAWTAAIAVAATVVSIVHLLGPNPLGLALPANALLALILWVALLPAVRFHKLISQYKDLYILHFASLKTRRQLKYGSVEDRHERLFGAMRRGARRAWKLSAAACIGFTVVAALATNMVLKGMRPEVFPVAQERFEAAWNGGDVEAVGELFDPRVRAKEARWLSGVVTGHGWRASLPPLSEGTVTESEGRNEVAYEVDGVPLVAEFVLSDLNWNLAHVELPIPSLDETLEKFLDAWKLSDPEELTAYFERRDEMLAAVEKAVADRGWVAFPEVVGSERENHAEDQVVVTVQLEGDLELKTRWEHRGDGTWGLTYMRFPAR